MPHNVPFIKQVVMECCCSAWHLELSEAGRASSLHPPPCWSQCGWLSPTNTDKLTFLQLITALCVVLTRLCSKQTWTFVQKAVSASRPGTATRSPLTSRVTNVGRLMDPAGTVCGPVLSRCHGWFRGEVAKHTEGAMRCQSPRKVSISQ